MSRERGPRAGRPSFPQGYGVPETEDGMLPWGWVEEHLVSARNYWIATTRADGSPHAMPVWGLWLEGSLVFSTSPDSRKGRNLRRDPRAVAHLESGDEVVVLEGEVERTELDEEIARAYFEKYDYRPEPGSADQGWYRLRPRVAHGWTEAGFPKTATRFTFDYS